MRRLILKKWFHEYINLHSFFWVLSILEIMQKVNLSWIVATLGNKNELEKIYISALNLSKEFNVKIELIFCLPPNKKLSQKNILKFKNNDKNFKFQILNSPKKGQVFQRNYALKYANYDTVIISDDDIEIHPKAILKLIKIKKSLPLNSVVGPRLIPYQKQLKPLYPDTFLMEMGFPVTFIKKFLNVNCLGMGEATDLGIGCSFCKIEKKLCEVGWLPGAFTLHTRKNIFLSDLYSWEGKAYAEDFFHSVSLRMKNINYFYIKDITYKCDLTFSNDRNLFRRLRELYLTFIRIYQVQFRLYKTRLNIKLVFYFFLIVIYKFMISIKKLII